MLLKTGNTVDSPMTEADQKLSPSHFLFPLFLPLSPPLSDPGRASQLTGPDDWRRSSLLPALHSQASASWFAILLPGASTSQTHPSQSVRGPVKLSVKPIFRDNKSPQPYSYYDWLEPSSSISDLLIHSDSESISNIMKFFISNLGNDCCIL